METDRTSRHPIRFTIFAAIAVALATMALVVVSSGNNSALAASSLNNGNFETGNLTGWSVDTATSGGAASAVDRYVYEKNPYAYYDTTEIIPPREGSSFALLTSAGQRPQLTNISQPFEASNGDKVSGWVFFQTYTDYYDLSHGVGDDKAQVVITDDSGTTVATPFEDRVSWGFWQTYPGWRYWEYTFSGLTGTDQFRIEARLQIPGTTSCTLANYSGYRCSVMGLDDVKTSIAGSDTTPPETYITSGPDNGSHTTSTNATFEFYSNEQSSTFECRLWKDNAVVQEWAGCTSPKSYSNLSPGSYTFHVRATDPSGNVDADSAVRSWYIDTAPPDTTAPTVKSTVPAADATTGVDRTTNVTATFSEDMMASSINTNTFKLFKKGSTTKLAASISYSADTATLDPSNSLRSGSTYKAVVTTGAKDLAGNSLDQDSTLGGLQQKTWFFKVSN